MLKAKWKTVPESIDGEFDDALGVYVNPVTRVPLVIAEQDHEMDIPAYFDDSRDAIFRYATYGINVEYDTVVLIPEDFQIPGTAATYYKTGSTIPYRIKQFIDRAHIGVLPGTTVPQNAYKILHLTRDDIE